MASLILAIESDPRQAAHLRAIARQRLGAEIVLADTTERALHAIGNRVPDLVLVPALLSPQDDAALAQALRVIATAAHVQMLTIPVLASPQSTRARGGVLSALRRERPRSAATDGCDPAVFAEQIRSYLEQVERERAAQQEESAALEAEVPTRRGEAAAVPAEAAVIPAEVAFTPAEVAVAPAEAAVIPAEAAVAPAEAAVVPAEAAAESAQPVFATSESQAPEVPEIVPAAAETVAETPEIISEAAEVPPETVAEEPAIDPFARLFRLFDKPEPAAMTRESLGLVAMAGTLEPAPKLALPELVWAHDAAESIIAAQAAKTDEPQPVLHQVEPAPIAEEPVEPGVMAEAFDSAALAAMTEHVGGADTAEPPAVVEVTDQPAPSLMPVVLEPPSVARETEFEAPVLATNALDEILASLESSGLPAIEEVRAEPWADPGDSQPVTKEEEDFLREFGGMLETPRPVETTPSPEPAPADEPVAIEPATQKVDPWMPLTAATATWPRLEQPDVTPRPAPAAVHKAEPVKQPLPQAEQVPAAVAASPEWVELIASLRQDMERRRDPAPREQRPPRKQRSIPIEDEWGFFDPEQCGFAALLAKLEEITQ